MEGMKEGRKEKEGDKERSMFIDYYHWSVNT